MCTMQSKPSVVPYWLLKPTIKETPILLQSPPLLNSVKTDFALACGARIHNGVMMANKPTTWIIRVKLSTIGSFFTRKVLKMIASAVIAMVSNVPCQRSAL